MMMEGDVWLGEVWLSIRVCMSSHAFITRESKIVAPMFVPANYGGVSIIFPLILIYLVNRCYGNEDEDEAEKQRLRD